MRVVSHGLRIGPNQLVSPPPDQAQLSRLSLATSSAPALSRRSVTIESASETYGWMTLEPKVIGMPAMATLSLMPKRLPASLPPERALTLHQRMTAL